MTKESTEPTALETLTTNELWDELQKRFIGCVLIFEYEAFGSTVGPSAQQSANGLWWKGSLVSALGFCEYACIRTRKMIKNWDIVND